MSEQVRDGGAAPEVPLPPGIALAWGRAERPRRGPKPGLSLERIVAAGIGLAVTDGPSLAPPRWRCTGTCRPRTICSR